MSESSRLLCFLFRLWVVLGGELGGLLLRKAAEYGSLSSWCIFFFFFSSLESVE